MSPTFAAEAVTEVQPSARTRRRAGWSANLGGRLNDVLQLHPAMSFGILTIFYVAALAGLSWVKLLWLDELITLHIARLNSIPAIWHALASGADPNPPLIHIAVMFCRRLFGEHAFALRIPAMIGYWIGMLSLFLFLKRRVAVAWALTGTVLSMGMGGFEWSYESRSYAIVYGMAMLALYCWVRAIDAPNRRTRNLALAGLTLALACGICANYFAVISFIPIAAAELTRTIISVRRSRTPLLKNVDWAVWGGMAIACTPLLVFRPMIERSIGLYRNYAWNKVTVDSISQSYIDMIGSIGFPLIALLAVAAAICVIARFAPDRYSAPHWLRELAADYWRGTSRPPLFTWPERVAALVLLIHPVVGYCVASLHGGMLSPRFVIAVCFGAAIVSVAIAARVFGHFRSAGIFALVLALLWFAGREAYVGYFYESEKESLFRVIGNTPPPAYPGEPIAVSDNLLLLPFRYYAPPEIASRVVYPIDFPGIMRGRGEASGEINLWMGRNGIYDFPIIPLATFQSQTKSYVIITAGRDWLVGDLLSHHYTVEPLYIDTQSIGLEFWATPLSHGKPIVFRAAGDLFDDPQEEAIPFIRSENLPTSEPTR